MDIDALKARIIELDDEIKMQLESLNLELGSLKENPKKLTEAIINIESARELLNGALRKIRNL